MAIEERKRLTKGRRKVYSYRVKWRYQGTGPQQSRTVDNKGDAEALEAALKAAKWAFMGTDPEIKLLTIIGRPVPTVAEAKQDETITLDEIVFRWSQRPGLAPGSVRIYQNAHKRLGTIGKAAPKALDKHKINDWYNGLAGVYAATTIDPVRIAVCSAMREYGCAEAIVDIVGIEAERKVEPIFLTPDEMRSLVATVTLLYGKNIGLAVLLAGTLGLRWGEVFGLQVKHLSNLTGKKPMLHIRQAIKNDDRLCNGFKPTTLKSPKSKRDLPLTPELAALLAETVEGLSERDVVFKPANKPFMNYRTWENWWNHCRSTCEDSPDIFRFHDLRHTAAKNLLVESKVPISYLSKMLGHSKIEVTIKEYGAWDSDVHDYIRDLMSGAA